MLKKTEKLIKKQVDEAKEGFDNLVNEIETLAKTKMKKLSPNVNYSEEAL